MGYLISYSIHNLEKKKLKKNCDMNLVLKYGQIRKRNRVMVKNLSPTSTVYDVRRLLEDFDSIIKIRLFGAKNKRNRVALVYFNKTHQSLEAVKKINGLCFQGRFIYLALYEKSQQKLNQSNEISKKFNFMSVDKITNKTTSENNSNIWNPFFIRQDTMIETIAKYYHIHKPNLLTSNADGLNVKISQGETWLIAETKYFLAAAGINIDKLERITKFSGYRKIKVFDFSKSTTTILVRNLPYEVTLDDLTEVFGKLGIIARIVLPETITLAIIEYNEPKNAKTAFNLLAFQYFMEVPLYLEWAPKDIFACSKENTLHMGLTTFNTNVCLPLIPDIYNKKLEFDRKVLGNKQKSKNQLQEIDGKKSEKQYSCSSNDNISQNKEKENEFRAGRMKTDKIKL